MTLVFCRESINSPCKLFFTEYCLQYAIQVTYLNNEEKPCT
jgi:hypothetical protein